MQRPPILFQKTKQFIAANGLIIPGQHVAIAVSGGIDSIVLLDLLSQLREEWKLTLSVLHVNHTLRGKASSADEQFVRSRCAVYKIPVYVLTCATQQLARRKTVSIQVAARDARYQFFSRERKKIKADIVVTAHTADDVAETVLLNLFRGTGIDGLAGIPVRREDIPAVRPLLFATRKEIIAYAAVRKLRHREDATNATDKYARNFVRHRIIAPVVKNLQPAAVEHIAAAAGIVRSASEVLDERVNKAVEKAVLKDQSGISIRLAGLKRLPEYVRHMVLHRSLQESGIEPSATRIAALRDLVTRQAGSRFQCGAWTIERTADFLHFQRKSPRQARQLFLKNGGSVLFGNQILTAQMELGVPGCFEKDGRTEYVDAAQVKFPLVVRSWQAGDRFVPLGMTSGKKVSDFFVDAKIAGGTKATVPVILSGDGILWIAGYRIDNRYKITKQTRSVIRLTVRRIES
jgi:tRNA(Ile)-lysidine synthase